MRRAALALALALALPLPSMAGEVRVQPGETLSEIADRTGVSMKRLVELNNITDPDHLEAGTQLRLPAGIGGPASRGGQASAGGTVTVGEGDTLSDIADRHGLSVSTLMALNNLSDPNHVEAGQVLKLRGARSATGRPSRPATTSTAFSYTPGASEHVVRKGESLSAIARGHGISVSQLVSLNALADPNNVPAGSTLRLNGRPAEKAPATTPAPQRRPEPRATSPSQPKPTPASTVAAAPRAAGGPVQQAASGKSDWRTYGPLQVDWTSWQPMGGSMVAAMVNGKGESYYTAINCGARKINSTNAAGQWGLWNDPASEVETKLVNDYCSRRGA
jgi:LysM repeat protein